MKSTHQSTESILFVVAQCNLFNFHLEVASQITGAFPSAELKSQDAACRLGARGEQKWAFLRYCFHNDIVHRDHLPLTVSKCQRSCLSALQESRHLVPTQPSRWLSILNYQYINLLIKKIEYILQQKIKNSVLYCMTSTIKFMNVWPLTFEWGKHQEGWGIYQNTPC